jgi:predicted membrane channel-forming protein YqfA (hemolysin III family)
MKNKIPMKYRIIFIILMMPIVVIPLISLLTPYNLMENPLISYGMVFSDFCAVGVGIYGTYFASKLNKKGGVTK